MPAQGTDPLGTPPMSDVKIPLTPARAAAILRALAALDAIPAHRRDLDLREHQLITGARTAGATWQEIAARIQGPPGRPAALPGPRPPPRTTVTDAYATALTCENIMKICSNKR